MLSTKSDRRHIENKPASLGLLRKHEQRPPTYGKLRWTLSERVPNRFAQNTGLAKMLRRTPECNTTGPMSSPYAWRIAPILLVEFPRAHVFNVISGRTRRPKWVRVQ